MQTLIYEGEGETMSTSIGKLIRAMRAMALETLQASRRSRRDEPDAYLIERLAERGSLPLTDAPRWVWNVAVGMTRGKPGQGDRRSPSLREQHLAALISVRSADSMRRPSPGWVLDVAAGDEYGRPAIRSGRQP